MDSGGGPTRLWVLEDEPPADREGWYCHGDVDLAPGFDVVEDAVAWGLARVDTVVVRTLGMVFYWAGAAPTPAAAAHLPMRTWPPPGPDRERIDADYAAAVVAAAEREAADEEYLAAFAEWARTQAPAVAGYGPLHECSIVLPAPPDGGAAEGLEFLEFVAAGLVCAARTGDGRHAFGPTEHVLRTLTGLPPDDPWLAAVCRALDRERTWNASRRSILEVYLAEGEMLHVTASANRESIARHGLDWRRMGAASGIAGSTVPELPAVFLCDPESVGFFARMSLHQTDVWAVRVDGMWTEPGPDGWQIVLGPVPADRLRLVETDRPAGRTGRGEFP